MNKITLEIEKFLDHRRVDDKMIYMVKWQDSAVKDWVSVDNFNTMEVINKYHQQLEAELEKPSVQRKLLKGTTAAAKNENIKLKDSNTQESNHAMTTRSKRNSTNTAKLNYLWHCS